MRYLKVDNYIISTPILDIIRRIQLVISNGKLRDIKIGKDNLVVTCPNDEHAGGHESKPACNVYIGDDSDIEYGYARCFVCGFEGSFVKFVAEAMDTTENQAKQWLITNFGEKAEEKLKIGDEIVLRKPVKTKYLDESILKKYQDWCPYLGQRKLTRETCEKFEVKYDPYYRQVIFPCRDVAGNLVMLPKRSIDTKTFYLDKDKEKPVYLLNNIIKNNIKKAIITEGPFDALTGNQYGAPTIATLGTISDYQIAQLNKSGLTILYTMFDNDEAGRKFTEIINKKLTKRIIVVNIQIPSPYKDINDLSYDKFWEILKKYQY